MNLHTVEQFAWGDVPVEQLNPMITRQVVWGAKTTLVKIRLTKNCFIPEHSHESEQLSWVQSGRIRLTIAGQDHDLGPGDVLRIPSWVPHSALVLDDCDVVDIFSPIRSDWLERKDAYLRNAGVGQQ